MPSTDSTQQNTGRPVLHENTAYTVRQKNSGYTIRQKNLGCPILAAVLSRLGWDSTNFPHAPGSLIPAQIVSTRILLASILLALSIPAFAQAPPAPASRFVVVLDAAHGGDNPGATIKDASGASQPEKAITLALSVRLRSLLAARGISVVTTREADTAVDDDRRAAIGNHANARACISLHATQSGSGIHIFTSSLAPAEPARLVPWKTAQAAWVTHSLALAGVVNSAFLHAGMTVTLGRTALTAIDSMACPAVAIEVAPEIPSANAQPINPGDTEYQTRVAQALAAALLDWRTNAARTEADRP
jgi:N-acetylmuramoyl-L-alanine amidase